MKIRWDSKYENDFRTGLIGKLPDFNLLTSDINISSKESINKVLTDFTNIVRSVTDPLFSTHISQKEKIYFNDSSYASSAEWFDLECSQAKERYLEAFRVFQNLDTNFNRERLCECKLAYKKLICKKKKSFESKKLTEIENLRHGKPKQFWAYFKRKHDQKYDISADEFFNYFSTLENDIFTCENKEAEEFCSQHDFNTNESSNEELDKEITISEILSSVKRLKSGKAHGSDCLLNEFFLESVDILAPYLCDLFNAILNSGYFPEQWTEGIIIPLYKKGDKKCVNNYRGITLLSCLSKIFTSVLNSRLENFCKANDTISDAQFGFRKGRSTVDAMFALLSAVQNYLSNNKRLYVAFVDLKKCFDSIYRNALWLKLFRAGIQGKMLRIIKCMYEKVKSCVKSCNTFSEFFEYSVGLRQGEVISPILVSLFLEDLELYLQNRAESGLLIDDIILIILLFADDMVILGKSPEELQYHLDLLHTYCSNWGLEVNAEKTKIMVFRKRGRLLWGEHWTYNNQEIEVVDEFNYLGTIFKYTGNFSSNTEYIVGKALKALNVLLVNCKKLPLKPKILCQLFDAFVGSILLYASEIWGFSKSKEIERVHLKFCKHLLNVRLNTCTAGVYGELGRYPLYISRYVRIIKYWCKVVNSDNIIIKKLYEQGLRDCKNGNINWVTSVKKLLNEYGYSFVFTDAFNVDLTNFQCIFKQRVIDCFFQDWYGKINNSVVLEEYKYFKNGFGYEKYLDMLRSDLRFYISRFRLSVHSLRIQSGRYARNAIPRNERYCLCCQTTNIEDMFHFIFVCPCYRELRESYINKYYYYRPSMFKLTELFKSSSMSILQNLSKYIKQALKKRSSILNNYR